MTDLTSLSLTDMRDGLRAKRSTRHGLQNERSRGAAEVDFERCAGIISNARYRLCARAARLEGRDRRAGRFMLACAALARHNQKHREARAGTPARAQASHALFSTRDVVAFSRVHGFRCGQGASARQRGALRV